MRTDLASLRAKRHANANLAGALRDRVTEHAVGADGGEKQRDPGENSSQQRGRTTRDETLGDERVHRANIIDRELRMGYAHQLSQRLSERFRTLARARDDVKRCWHCRGRRRAGKPPLAPLPP